MDLRVSIVLLVGIALAFAGCAGSKGSPATNAPSSTVQATASGLDAPGSIRGQVVDDQIAPVEGAQVGIVKPITLTAITGPDGSFAFQGLSPGTYEVVAQKLGYDSQAKAVQVADAEVPVTFTLASIPVETSYHTTLPAYNGFIGCAVVRPGVQGYVGSTTYDFSSDCEPATGAGQNAFDFHLTSANVHSIVGETRWSPGVAASSSSLQTFFSYKGGSGTHWWCSGSGHSPTSFVWSVDENVSKCFDHGSSTTEPVPTTKLTLETSVFLPFTKVNPAQPTNTDFVDFAVQQKYETVVTIFYGEAPPPGFSGFTDG